MKKINSHIDLKSRWQELRNYLKEESTTDDNWVDVFNIFEERLQKRYLNPIEQLLKVKDRENNYKNFEGWGFSISVILSSLIEHLSSTINGKISVKHLSKHNFPSIYCYKDTKSDASKFSSFFSSTPPFNNQDDRKLYKSYFKDIRSVLFHDARVSNSWKIKTHGSIAIDSLFQNEDGIDLNQYPIISNNILYRESFYSAIKYYTLPKIKEKVKNNKSINGLNIRNSLARKMDIIFSEDDKFEDIDMTAYWWNAHKKRLQLSTVIKGLGHLILRPFILLFAIAFLFTGCLADNTEQPTEGQIEKTIVEPEMIIDSYENERSFMVGNFVYYADAAIFTNCYNQEKYVVLPKHHKYNQSETYLQLETYYLENKTQAGQPLLMEIEGHWIENLNTEGINQAIVPTKFIIITEDAESFAPCKNKKQ